MSILGGLDRKFVLLRATRWLPTGLVIPVLVLLLVSRGLSLGQIGIGLVGHGLVVFALELPTGGLADALGRRPVLLVGTAVEAVSMLVLLMADSVAEVALLFVLQGIYRALESGPLDAWYVDATRAVDPDADVTKGLSYGGTAIGLAIAAGALVSGGLVAWSPMDSVEALAVPVVVAAFLRLFDMAAIATLMTEESDRPDFAAIEASVRHVPSVVVEGLSLIRASRVLAALIFVELLWGFGLTSYETLVPPRIAEVAAGPETAAVIFGPIVTVAWLVSAGFAALVPRITRRIGHVAAAIFMHLAQVLAIVGMAVVAGPFGVVAFYLLTMGFHGALNPIYQALIHRHADAAHRTTILSATSMVAHPGGALGGVLLGYLADTTSISVAMIVGAGVLIGVIPLYMTARTDGRPSPSVA